MEILKAFGMMDYKHIGIPMEGNLKLSIEDSTLLVDSKKCKKLVGSLIFLRNTRLDICYAVGVISKFSNKPRESHWNASMQILRYIQGILTFGILYNVGDNLASFCDLDWARDYDARKSIFG